MTPTRTPYFGFEELDNDPLSSDGYKFSKVDPGILDSLLKALARHAHSGEAPLADPNPLTLGLSSSGGHLPAGFAVFYRHTWVDIYGNESGASSEVTISTPAGVASPGAPGLAVGANASGTLRAGTYFYRISAYTGDNHQETLAGPTAVAVIPAGQTAKITVTLPGPATGVTGYNIYRQGPGDAGYYYLTSVVAATTTFADDGATAPVCTRFPPTTNSTISQNQVIVTVPGGATPTVPTGYTWKLYRTFQSGQYAESLLAEITDGSPQYIDTGLAPTFGQPPDQSHLLGGLLQVVGLPSHDGWLPISSDADDTDGYDEAWAVAVGTKIYVGGACLGGAGACPSPHTWQYDTVAETWLQRANNPIPMENAAAVNIGGKIYVAGGDGSGTGVELQVYDPAANTWTRKADMPTIKDYPVGVVFGGKFLVMGGQDGVGAADALIYSYDTVANTWSTFAATMPSFATEGSAPWVIGSELFVAGGISGAGVYSRLVWKYNGASAFVLQSGVLLPVATAYGGSAVVGGKGYMIGGDIDPNYAGRGQRVIQFDPTVSTPADRISVASLLPAQISFNAAAVVGTTIYSFGGNGSSSTGLPSNFKSGTITGVAFTELLEVTAVQRGQSVRQLLIWDGYTLIPESNAVDLVAGDVRQVTIWLDSDGKPHFKEGDVLAWDSNQGLLRGVASEMSGKRPASKEYATFDRGGATIVDLGGLTTARLYLFAVTPPQQGMASDVYGHITAVSGATAGAGLTFQKFGVAVLLDNGVFHWVASTNNDGATAWPADTAKTLAFASPVAVGGGAFGQNVKMVYFGVLVLAATPPSLVGVQSRLSVASLDPMLAGYVDGGATPFTDTPSDGATITPTALDKIAYLFGSRT